MQPNYADMVTAQRMGMDLGNASNKMPDFNPNEVPGFGGTDIAESHLTNDDLGSASQVKNDAVNTVNETSVKRGYIKIDDAMIENSEKLLDPKLKEFEAEYEAQTINNDVDEKVNCEEGDDKVVQQVCHKHLEIELKVTPEVISYSYSCPGHTGQRAYGGSGGDGGSTDYQEYSYKCNPGCKKHTHITPKKVEIISENWHSDCDNLENQADLANCSLDDMAKIDVDTTKTISGENITRAHWGEKHTYSCVQKNNNTCNALRSKG